MEHKLGAVGINVITRIISEVNVWGFTAHHHGGKRRDDWLMKVKDADCNRKGIIFQDDKQITHERGWEEMVLARNCLGVFMEESGKKIEILKRLLKCHLKK